MRTIEISDDIDNLADLLSKDSIGRNEHIISFIKLLCCVENKAVIALDGGWGAGKTIFTKQVKIILDSMNSTSQLYESEIAKSIRAVWTEKIGEDEYDSLNSFSTVYYDAWSHDNADDPLLSLVYEIMKTGAGDKIGHNVDWTNILASIGEDITELKISNLIKELKGEDYFANIKNKESVDDMVSTFLDSLIKERGNKLVVFVDELDRCAPIYAVRLLERVKHFFNHDNVIFVFSMNISELESVIKNCYGAEYNSSRYLDRFFDLRISLPAVKIEQYIKYIGINQNGGLREEVEKQVIKDMHLELREVNKYILISRWAAFLSTEGKDSHDDCTLESNQTAKIIVFRVILPIAIGLRMIDEHKYNDFISGKDPSWLLTIVSHESLSEWVGKMLLSTKELFDDNEKNMVKFEDRIVEAYNAIFNYDYGQNWDKYQCSVGNAKFSEELREEFYRALGLMSRYSLIN
ncbi:P-loop NTPase fold protein [Pseudobutyrivibrio sp.]|uniref:KAP family P-loop NTPase fold protein n=1 Tax=Pseudobutyrivibrio sp. TaxID=2014367 RepID=UPI0038704C59